MTDEPIRILIADDHTLFRDGLRALFDSLPDVTAVGEAADGGRVVQLAQELQPDVILMDIQMPGLNGIDATRSIVRASPHIGVIILTMFEDDDSVFAAMRAGALGYVLKGINHAEMVQTVRMAAAGGAVFSPQIAAYILQWFAQGGNPPMAAEEPAVELPMLTQREHEVLQLLAAGCDNNTIADRLTVTEKTVRNYVSQLLKKLEVSDRHAAAEKARRAGLDEG